MSTTNILVYQSYKNDYIVVMSKFKDTFDNERRNNVTDKNHALYRADKLKIERIYHKLTLKDVNELDDKYKVGNTLIEDNYSSSMNDTKGAGINYYLSEEAAFSAELPTNYTGHFKTYCHDGGVW